MTTPLPQDAAAKISEADEAVRRAEAILEKTMKEVEVNTRADKKMIGEALRTAFEALRVARSKLEALHAAR